jgi:hypothetical protein
MIGEHLFCGAKRRQINIQTFLFFNSALLGKFVLFILISVALVIGIAATFWVKQEKEANSSRRR